MTQKQINRYHVIKDSLEGNMTVGAAASALGISERQVTRLRNGVKEKGVAFMIHKNTGRSPGHAVSEDEKREIVSLYSKEKYEGSNFLHFSELLSEHEGITRSCSTVNRVLKEAKIESPKKRRRYKPHRSRKRKAQEGLLIQMDASQHRWFGGNALYSLHGGIDDATSKIVGLYMTKNECLQGHLEVVRQTVGNNGVPISIYADRHTIFRSPNADKLTIEQQLEGKQTSDTQFGRAVKELGITIIAARSPQAKGRIERLWETLQSRLVVEFRIHDIKTLHEANMFLMDYIPKFNAQFAVEPDSTESAYVQTNLDLDLILCAKEKRTVDNGAVFSFKGKHFKVVGDGFPGNKIKIDVVANAAKGIFALYDGKIFDVLPFVKPKKLTKPKADAAIPSKPADDHPFRNIDHMKKRYSSDLVDSEIRKMLDDIFLSKYA